MEDINTINTLDSFRSGFKIIRDGKIITLTEQEMADFRYLDTALVGRECIECNEGLFCDEDLEILNKLRENKSDCYRIESEILDTAFSNIGETEIEIISDFINREKIKNRSQYQAE